MRASSAAVPNVSGKENLLLSKCEDIHIKCQFVVVRRSSLTRSSEISRVTMGG
jgi:hypothetical protein